MGSETLANAPQLLSAHPPRIPNAEYDANDEPSAQSPWV